jgi:hypothetical protein
VVLGGVPVHNYDLRHEIHDTNSTHLRGQAVYDWLLEFKGEADGDEIHELCSQLPGSARCVHKGHPGKDGLPMVVLRATRADLEACLAAHSDLLDHAEADVKLSMAGENDLEASEVPWGLDRIDARSGFDGRYNSTGEGRGVHVYIIDSGIRTTHVDFKASDGSSRAVPTLEVNADEIIECDKTNTECAMDDHGHGTHVAGTLGGTTYGVAKGTTLHSVKIYYGNGVGSKLGWFLTALDWVIVNGARPMIVSVSMGAEGVSSHQAVDNAIAKAAGAGVTVVVGAGNGREDACKWTPASAPDAITVGATDRSDARWSGSNWGKCVDIFAPGVDINSAGLSSDTASVVKTGTSMATPHVSGAAALLLEEDPNLSPAEVAQKLRTRSTIGALSNTMGSDNLLLYTGDLPPMGPVPTTTTTTMLLQPIRVAGGSGGCLKVKKVPTEEGVFLVLEEGTNTDYSTLKGCARFAVAGKMFQSLEHQGKCLEYFYGRTGWALWSCRDVHNQKLQKKGVQWCVDSKCVEEVPPTTESFDRWFKIITQGQCSDHPDLRTATREECAQGVTWHLKKKFNNWDLKGKKGKRRASGCLWNKDWKLRYNLASESTQPCGTLERSCVCTRVQPNAR